MIWQIFRISFNVNINVSEKRKKKENAESDLSILCHTVCSTRPGVCVSIDVSRTRFRASEMLRKASVIVISSSSIEGLTWCLLLEGGDTCERGMR
jgi:hypothetical protein